MNRIGLDVCATSYSSVQNSSRNLNVIIDQLSRCMIPLLGYRNFLKWNRKEEAREIAPSL